jgi:hypothetical protein
MYNTKVICTYHTEEVFLETDNITEEEKTFIRDVIYRQELINIFEKDDFDGEDINNAIYELYKRLEICIKLRECMKKVAEKFLQSEEVVGLCILFSYDYMYLTHKCISEYLEKGSIPNDDIIELFKLIE